MAVPMANFLAHLVVICLALHAVKCWAVDDEGCRTPDRGVGNCILANDCKPLINVLNSSTVTPRLKRKLRAYACGYQEGKVKVCCPEGPLFPLDHGRKLPTKSTQPSQVNSRHENWHLLPEECGYSGAAHKISLGQNTVLGEFPWMALLSYDTPDGPRFKCGGTVINSKYILTAAHCITNLKHPLLSVRVGEYDVSKPIDCETSAGKTKCAPPVQDLTVERATVHPNFTTSYDNEHGFNDIGLLRVSGMNLSVATVKPICLPTGDAQHVKLKKVIVTGWGFTEEGFRASNVLKRTDVPVVNLEVCRRMFKKMNVSPSQLCANGRRKETCRGDSGGPLQRPIFLNDEIRNVQYGIISLGGANCGAGIYPGLYTKVSYYIDWILDNIEP